MKKATITKKVRKIVTTILATAIAISPINSAITVSAALSDENSNAETLEREIKYTNINGVGISFSLLGEATGTLEFWSGKKVDAIRVKKENKPDNDFDLKDVVNNSGSVCKYTPPEYGREDFEVVLQLLVSLIDITDNEERNRLDVNGDGDVSIADACVIANWYNRIPSNFIVDEYGNEMSVNLFYEGTNAMLKCIYRTDCPLCTVLLPTRSATAHGCAQKAKK